MLFTALQTHKEDSHSCCMCEYCVWTHTGDFRMMMGIAENPKKVNNIVSGGYDDFQQLYRRPLQVCFHFEITNCLV
jgi:Phosphatidate cytidylyltransferase, mitochondrial